MMQYKRLITDNIYESGMLVETNRNIPGSIKTWISKECKRFGQALKEGHDQVFAWKRGTRHETGVAIVLSDEFVCNSETCSKDYKSYE